MTTAIKQLALAAKRAQPTLLKLTASVKNDLLHAFADALLAHLDKIRLANQQDIEAAKAQKMQSSLIDRLTLDKTRITQMATSLYNIAKQTDPIGDILESRQFKNGIALEKVRVPIGVIGIIYESRPNVTTDVAGLCLKTGNAVILKGGKESIHSNKAIVTILHQVLLDHSIDTNCLQFIDSTSREATYEMLSLNDTIDLIIPRGGKNLIQAVQAHSSIPVLKHLEGICHIYVHEAADLTMAESIIINAKCQRPGVCNALETLLVDEAIASTWLPKICARLRKENVQLIGCDTTCAIMENKNIQQATEQDWQTEYLDLILSIRVVANIEQAIEHINHYGSHHSDCIITKATAAANTFLNAVDSACVYHNASTRFTDGGEFGMGAEMGISTDKLHARGPVALNELTSYKYILRGNGQIRE